MSSRPPPCDASRRKSAPSFAIPACLQSLSIHNTKPDALSEAEPEYNRKRQEPDEIDGRDGGEQVSDAETTEPESLSPPPLNRGDISFNPTSLEFQHASEDSDEKDEKVGTI